LQHNWIEPFHSWRTFKEHRPQVGSDKAFVIAGEENNKKKKNLQGLGNQVPV